LGNGAIGKDGSGSERGVSSARRFRGTGRDGVAGRKRGSRRAVSRRQWARDGREKTMEGREGTVRKGEGTVRKQLRSHCTEKATPFRDEGFLQAGRARGTVRTTVEDSTQGFRSGTTYCKFTQ